MLQAAAWLGCNEAAPRYERHRTELTLPYKSIYKKSKSGRFMDLVVEHVPQYENTVEGNGRAQVTAV